MRVLFLDIDGVLLAGRHWRSGERRPGTVPRDTVEMLNVLCDDTQCRVVVSSTWRRDFNCRQILREAGFRGDFHAEWRTPVNGSCRGDEIALWLSGNPDVTSYAIIDDDSDMLPEHAPVFVQTAFEDGIQREHVERLASILKAA